MAFERMRHELLSRLPPSPTPEEAEAERQAQADREAKREQQRRITSWDNLAASRGKRYGQCSLANYDCQHDGQEQARGLLRGYCEQMLANVQDGAGVVLYGPPGTGKDHFMAALMRAAIVRYGLRVRWMNGMDLFGELRDRISEEQRESDWVRGMAHPQVLAISDPLPPAGVLSEHQVTMLFRAIDRRYSERKPTWITMNVKDKEEAEKRMSAQLVQRLMDNSLVVFCNWPSYRKSR